jgi:hypothetical protein
MGLIHTALVFSFVDQLGPVILLFVRSTGSRRMCSFTSGEIRPLSSTAFLCHGCEYSSNSQDRMRATVP